MPAGEHDPADVAIVASASADELRFEAQPRTRTRFPGSGERDSGQSTTRTNIDSPVQVGRTYRRVFAATRISSRLIDPPDPSRLMDPPDSSRPIDRPNRSSRG